MEAAHALNDLLRDTRISKTQWCNTSGVSRALLDDYLKARKQPSVAQLDRLIEATGMRATLRMTPLPRPAPAALIDVLELGELFPPEAADPLPDLSPVWRARRHG